MTTESILGPVWGPTNVPLPDILRRPVLAVLAGIELREITKSIQTYWQDNPNISRQSIVELLHKSKSVRRYTVHRDKLEYALDTLNQLSILDRTAEDVNSVIVYSSRDRTAAGQHHLFYEISWIREPEKKLSSIVV